MIDLYVALLARAARFPHVSKGIIHNETRTSRLSRGRHIIKISP